MEKDYYVHKTAKRDDLTIASIFFKGLRCNYFTPHYTINHLGLRIDQNLLDNYAEQSKIIFIIAVPKNYVIAEDEDEYPELVNAETDAFMYQPADEDVPYLRGEFVYGYYIPEEKRYVLNQNFFENLSPESKKKLFSQVDKEYQKIYEKIDEPIAKLG